MIGELLGNRYKIVQKIGGGGMALVYKAKCQLLNRFVAIKILRSELVEDHEFVHRFNSEAQAAASLSHPNIVSIYDVGQEQGIYYIVMEYVEGQTLKELIKKQGALLWQDTIDIAMQICSALEHAHKNRIIHRDIKPHNIIITEDGRAKVTDFGIARAVTSSTVTLGGNTIGSVHYFSPEQARGGYTDEKSDIYSLGIVMYEMLTGKVPFDGESPVSIAMKHIQDVPIPPREIKESIPSVIQSIILKAISKEQGKRYASATEMLEDMRKALKLPNEDFVNTVNVDDSPTQKVPIIKNIDGSDEMPKRKNKRKMKKEDRRAIIAAIITSIIIIGALGFAGYTFFGNYLPSKAATEVPVPNFIGQDINTAKTMYAEQGFNIIEHKQEYNNEYEEGQIIDQEPQPSMMVKVPTDIEVTISMGVKMIKVPPLRNKDYRQAEIELDGLKLNYIVKYEYNDKIPEGVVIRHEPSAETEVREGEVIYLYVSDGPEIKMVKVPDLKGKTEEVAKQMISQSDLVVGNVKREPSDAPKNTVINQSVAPNTEVKEKTTIDLVVSDGKPDNNKTVPITVRLPQDRESVEVKIVVIKNSEKYVVYQKVHKKDESPLDIPLKGKGTVSIELYFDDELVNEEPIPIDFGGVD